MVERRKIVWSRYIAAFSITVLIFLLGIMLGNHFAENKIGYLEEMSTDFKTDTLALEIQYDLIEENPCSSVNSTPLAEQLYDLATRLDYMENQLGESDPDVRALKEYYQLLEIRHWMFNKKTNQECDQNMTLVLYFYSYKKDCPECEQQGFILTWLRMNYPNVLVYAFDYNIDNYALATLKKQYDVTSTPAVVVGDKTYNRFMKKDELVKIVEDSD